MRKICIVTASRAEYGPLKWIMREIQQDPELTLQIVVTGTHLEKSFGNTVSEIEEDGFLINEKIKIRSFKTTPLEMIKSLSYCLKGVSQAFNRLKPDLIVILGDRYELLSITTAALLMNIPIAHISGGDITEGAIDDQIRHSISKIANIHFPGNDLSAKRLIQMGEMPDTVFNFGEPGLDEIFQLIPTTRIKLSAELRLESSKKWAVCTYHPETKLDIETNIDRLTVLLETLLQFRELQSIITSANADHGGLEINRILRKYSLTYPDKLIFVNSLGRQMYLSLLKESEFMIGNSSSGILESPIIPLYAINIGKRQNGRYLCTNVIQSDGSKEDLNAKISSIFSNPKLDSIDNNYPYGKGGASKKIVCILKEVSIQSLHIKKFYEGYQDRR